jgi:branched-chain amino acid transport system ATP-binding protein
MLEIKNLVSGYDGPDVLHGIDLEIAPGSLVAVIGANGAGKSTLLRTLSSLIKTRSGSISLDGKDLTNAGPSAIVANGMSHVPEGRQVFATMTVAENLDLGAYRSSRSVAAERLEKVLEIFPALKERLNNVAGSLSGGQQQMLAIGRGLMAEPKYLLLDEPSLGLAPIVVQTIFDILPNLTKAGVGVLLIEQNGQIALSIADRAVLLERGSITLRGTGQELLKNPEVIERYLGVGNSIGADPEKQRIMSVRIRTALGSEETGIFAKVRSKTA